MPRRAPHEVRPLSGSKAPAPGGNKPTRGYVYGFIVAYFVWSITPAAWLTLALRYYYKGSIFSVPRNAFGRFWCIYSMLEAVFSIYLQIITRRASRKVDPPKADIETLRALLTRALSAGLPPPPELQEDGAPKVNGHAAAGQNGTTKPQAPTTRTSTIGPQSKQGRQGLEALQARSVDEDEAAIRRERLRAWFHYVPLEDVWADNVREWLAWAFTARELKDAQSDPKVRALLDEGLEMVKYRLQWQTIRQGYNPRVKPIRLTIDPVQAMSRPLGYYVVTNGFTQAVITWMQLWHGFRYEKSRQCWFLVKDAERGSRRGATCSLPIMFAHGLGIGLGQYIPMLKQLGKHRDGVVILVQPHISTSIYSPQFLDPPTKDEQAQATIDLLQRKGFNAVTTLSHSNGTMVLGWLLRTKPEMFVRNVLVDPVSFCLWEGCECGMVWAEEGGGLSRGKFGRPANHGLISLLPSPEQLSATLSYTANGPRLSKSCSATL